VAECNAPQPAHSGYLPVRGSEEKHRKERQQVPGHHLVGAERAELLVWIHHPLDRPDKKGQRHQEGGEDQDRRQEHVQHVETSTSHTLSGNVRNQPPALQQALKPPGALTNQSSEVIQPLLVDLRLVGVDGPPSGEHEAHTEVKILGEYRRRPGLGTKRLQRAEPRELSVATETGESRTASTALKQLGVADELHVLETREQSGGAVPDTHSDLHGTDAWVGEADVCYLVRVRVQPPIGIQQADDDPVSGAAVEHRALGQILHGRIECGALALPRLRMVPPE
jgi:hypothetical protein